MNRFGYLIFLETFRSYLRVIQITFLGGIQFALVPQVFTFYLWCHSWIYIFKFLHLREIDVFFFHLSPLEVGYSYTFK